MSAVVNVETFIVSVPRDTPYLGPLLPGERINSRGYVVRKGNGTIYPSVDRSVVVRVTTADGLVGWGETYGICAPKAVCEIINDLLAPELLGQEPAEVESIWDHLYGMMRVRGSFGGFYVDAIAALDIALWDLHAREAGKPLRELLGESRRDRIPGYLSGLPAATLAGRVEMAKAFQAQGHDAFKIHAVVSAEGIPEEVAALREALGDSAKLMVDLHWKFDAEQAVSMSKRLAPYDVQFLEAPVKPEDVAGLARVASEGSIPVAAGEEWHTEYEAKLRLDCNAVHYIQPEMGHTGITQFRRIARLAEANGVQIAPHATIGTGIFLAASLHASTTLSSLWRHEWQHSIFSRSLELLQTDMDYVDGHYILPEGPGLGVTPSQRFWDYAVGVS